MTSRPALPVGVDYGVDGPAELGAIPPVGEQVDVLAHPLDESMSLEGISAGERKTVLAEHTQCQADQTVLKFVHGYAAWVNSGKRCSQARRTRCGSHRRGHTSTRMAPLT